MKLYHCSDLHLPNDPIFADVKSIKQLLGFLNWHTRRKQSHRFAPLYSLQNIVQNLNPEDHLLIGGDIINIGTEREALLSRHYLEKLCSPEQITITPGNHDAYRENSLKNAQHVWSKLGITTSPYPQIKPLMKQDGETLYLVALNSGVPTAPFFATGYIDNQQLEALAEFLKTHPSDSYILACHHPVLDDWTKSRKRLKNSDALWDILKPHPPKVILTGHIHHTRHTTYEIGSSQVEIYSVSSASSGHLSQTEAAQINILDCRKQDQGWHITQKFQPL